MHHVGVREWVGVLLVGLACKPCLFRDVLKQTLASDKLGYKALIA